MITYVVRHRVTGKFLPPLKACHSATSRELSDIPRIFFKRQDAVCAARWWANGVAYMHRTHSYSGEEDFWLKQDRVAERKLSDLELVEFDLFPTTKVIPL